MVLGLESGADDYIVSIQASADARIQPGCADRRPGARDVPSATSVGVAATVSGAWGVNLTPLQFDLLVALARKPGQVFTGEVLLEQVWGYRHAADTRLVNVHVQRLRAKIERDPERPEIVITVRGVGYKAGPG